MKRWKVALIGVSVFMLVPEVAAGVTSDPDAALWTQRLCMSVATAFGLFAMPPSAIIDLGKERLSGKSNE